MNSLREQKPGLEARNAAWEVLQLVAAGAYADVALERVLQKRKLKPLDKRLVMELAYGAIRRRFFLDSWIDYLGRVSACKQPPLLRWLLHVGLYQIFYMERIPMTAAVNTTVELIKLTKLEKLAPVVNGILRSAIRSKEQGIELPLPVNSAEILAQAESLPIWLSEQIICWRGEKEAEKIAKAFNQTPPFDIRVNRLRITPDELLRQFLAVDIDCKKIEGCPYGLQVSPNSVELRNWPGYAEGQWCVQDRSAQWVAPLLDPQPGDQVLDACAAPGGKTTHLVELMGNTGEVWAVDRSPSRLKRFMDNATRLGMNSLNILSADSARLLNKRPDWEKYFQRILLDVPCSGLGTLARHPDARWRISPEQIDELVIVQTKLLEGLLPLLSPGGRIVYSTCTIHPKENINQIEQFLSRHPELILLEEKQTWPDLDRGGDGFYAASLEIR